jgi:chromosome segregation ATPase
MGLKEFFFGKPPLADPVAQSEARIQQVCLFGPWLNQMMQKLDTSTQVVSQEKTGVIKNKERLEKTSIGYNELKMTIERQRQTAKNALEGLKAQAGSLEQNPDPVLQDVIDQHGESLRELQGGQIAGMDRAVVILETVVEEMDVREQNTKDELEELESKISRLEKVEQTLTTEENTISAFRKEMTKFAVLANVSPPGKQEKD